MPFVKLSNDLLCEQKPVMELINSLNDNEPIFEQIEKSNYEIDDYILQFLIKIAHKSKNKQQFIHEVSILTEADTLDKRADRITLMTLHASKGLEFKCVFIAGLENEILPLYRAKEENEIEEERRLLFVGMTRAKERLLLTHAEK